jgi:hypothetical protein
MASRLRLRRVRSSTLKWPPNRVKAGFDPPSPHRRVTSRGYGREAIFLADDARRVLLAILAGVWVPKVRETWERIPAQLL